MIEKKVSKELLCRKTGKVRHCSEGKTAAAIRALQKIRPSYDGIPYFCQACKGWHFGRLSKEKKVMVAS